METVYLTDITGTIGEWLDAEFDDEVPSEIVELLNKAYSRTVKELDKEAKIDKYNEMLRKTHGEHITVQIRSYIEDDDSTWYYYTSAKYGDSDAYETVEKAYEEADSYLHGVGELW